MNKTTYVDGQEIAAAPQVELTENHYFPTQIFSLQLPESNIESLNSGLITAIYAERDRNAKGIQRSNFRALGGWHSHNDLHKEVPYRPLVDLIATASTSICRANGYDERTALKIGTMWSIINPPGSANRAHVHPGSIWSGVYYVQTPENCGDIEFIDPRISQTMSPARYIPNKKRPRACWSKVSITPNAGKLLIFPSWLYHAVSPNMSFAKGAAAERVIISFNLNQTKAEHILT